MTGGLPPHEPLHTKDSVDVRREGRVVASADVTTTPEPHGTASVALTARHGEAPPHARSELVDQVMDHPGVRGSDNVHVVVPIGDSESIAALQEQTDNFTARAAGASSIIDADVPQPAVED